MYTLEKRHSKILDELDLEKERNQNNTLKSDEFFLLIEGERLKMQSQVCLCYKFNTF